MADFSIGKLMGRKVCLFKRKNYTIHLKFIGEENFILQWHAAIYKTLLCLECWIKICSLCGYIKVSTERVPFSCFLVLCS